jgi:hypothetical protein
MTIPKLTAVAAPTVSFKIHEGDQEARAAEDAAYHDSMESG